MGITNREKLQSFLKVLGVICLESRSPSVQFCFERHDGHSEKAGGVGNGSKGKGAREKTLSIFDVRRTDLERHLLRLDFG
jgi:hypothetical protein